MATHNTTGKNGEDCAAQYLEDLGYRIIARNWRNRGRKELDIVAIDGDTLVFVEVKTRTANTLTSPFDAVNGLKMHRLTLAADSFIRAHNINMNARFDVIGITGSKIEHIKNAFMPAATYY
ncbi:MAG: YraN family protein [Bacteroidaceae bacterium]|nr:YraN family protein [Bacteroidaceae bacterium]